MKINDDLGIKGRVSVVLLDSDGNIKAKRNINNLVVQAGKDLISQTFLGTSSATVTHVGIGTNSPAAAASLSQTALVSEVAPRVAIGTTTPTVSPATITYTATFAAGIGTGNVGEAGMFTASTSGTLVARTTFSDIPKGVNDIIIVTWTLIFG